MTTLACRADTASPAAGPSADSVAAGEPTAVLRFANGDQVSEARYADWLVETQGARHFDEFARSVVIDRRAQELGIEISPDAVERAARERLETLMDARFGGDRELARSQLGSAGLTLELWFDWIERQVRHELLARAVYRTSGQADAERIHSLWEARYGEEGRSRKVRVIAISKELSRSRLFPQAEWEANREAHLRRAEARATALHEAARSGDRTVAELADEHSDDALSGPGGDLGATWTDRFDGALAPAVEATPEGEVGPVVRSDAGFHIFEVYGTRRPVQVRGRIILIDGADDEGRNERERLRWVQHRLRSGEAFASVAADVSDARTGDRAGGETGWIGPTRYGTDAADAIAELEPGQRTPPVPTPRGWLIFELEERRQRDAAAEKLVRHLLIGTDYASHRRRWAESAGFEALVEERVAAAAAALEGGDVFADVAREYSDHAASRASGGLIDRYRPGTFGPEVDELVRRLEVGETSPPVETDEGWFIVRVEEEVVTPLSRVRTSLRDEARAQEPSPEELERFVEQLVREAPIVDARWPLQDRRATEEAPNAE